MNWDYLVYGLQIGVFQFYAVPRFGYFTFNQALGSNPEWVKQNPDSVKELVKKFPKPNASPSYVIGTVLMSCLILDSFMESSFLLGKIAHWVSILHLVFQCVVIDGFRAQKILQAIPAPHIRSASLTPRSIQSYVPLPFLVFVAASVLSIVIWHTWAVMEDIKVLKEVLAIFLTYAVLIGSCFYIVYQKPLEASPSTSDLFRKSGFWTTFAILLSFIVKDLIEIANTHFNFEMLEGLNSSYIFTLFPLLVFLWYLRTGKYCKLHGSDEAC